MSDKLRAAAQAALDLLSEDDRNADKCIRILEAALVEPKQEPVGKFSKFSDGVWKEVTASSPGIFLYTAPPRREWVGLTDEEIEQGNKESCVDLQAWQSIVWWAEDKLREKNT